MFPNASKALLTHQHHFKTKFLLLSGSPDSRHADPSLPMVRLRACWKEGHAPNTPSQSSASRSNSSDRSLGKSISQSYPLGGVFCSISPNQTNSELIYTKGRVLIFSRAVFSHPSISTALNFLPVILKPFPW